VFGVIISKVRRRLKMNSPKDKKKEPKSNFAVIGMNAKKRINFQIAFGVYNTMKEAKFIKDITQKNCQLKIVIERTSANAEDTKIASHLKRLREKQSTRIKYSD
jgi:hypothetical protein|tara:strand:- start:7393 stop:7704 length:312 start_codon:yes stop_codon:yes gene_type:complete